MKPFKSLLLVSVMLSGCGLLGIGGAREEKPSAETQRHLDELQTARADASAAPGDPAKAKKLAGMVEMAIHQDYGRRGLADPPALLAEAGAALDRAAAEHPEDAADIEYARARIWRAAGKKDESVRALRASMAAKATPRACVDLVNQLDKSTPKEDILALCKQALPNATSDNGRFDLLNTCLVRSGQKDPDVGLAWAGKQSIAFYKEEVAALHAESTPMDSPNTDQGPRPRNAPGASGGSARSGWTVNLKNGCARTVKLFVGAQPKYGSGTVTSLAANNLSSFTGGPGDSLWIIDEQEGGVASVDPRSGDRLVITSGCSGFARD